MEDDAYNSVGEHLVNDEEHSVGTMAASVIAGILSCAIIVAILL